MRNTQAQQKLLPIEQIKPNESNPRNISDDEFKKLVKSLQEFPEMLQAREVVVNKDLMILCGNMRYQAAKAAGIKEIPVKIVDWSEELQRQFIIKDNISNGEWDWDILANEWDLELLLDWGLDVPDQAIKATEDDVPEVDEETTPVSKPGEIYQLGSHRLMCGSSTDASDVVKLMDGATAHMTFTDPPYNVDYTGGMGTHSQNKRDGILNDKMGKEQFYQFLYDVSVNIMNNCNGAIYICMSSSELDTLKTSFESAGGHWQSFIIWVKNNFTLSRADYQHTYEPILYGWNGKTKNHYFVSDRDIPNVWEDLNELKSTFDGEYTTIKFHGFEVKVKGKVEGEVRRKKQKTDIWRYDKPVKSEEHPTMKPVRLCAEAIRNSSKKHDIVLDLFGGSGSTLIAAEQLYRQCYMMELDPKFVDVIRKRYWKYVNNDNEAGWQENTPAI